MYKKPRKSLTWVTKTFTWTIFNLDLDQIDLLDTKHITTSEHAYTQYENVFTNVFNKHAQSKTRQTRKKTHCHVWITSYVWQTHVIYTTHEETKFKNMGEIQKTV